MVKNYTENYLQNTIYKNYWLKKINKNFNCYPPAHSAFSGSMSLSEIEIK